MEKFWILQKVCIQLYTLNTKCLDCVELSSIPFCCKIPSRLVPHVSKGPWYGNSLFFEKCAKTEISAMNRQLGKPILRFWESRGPGSISARSAYPSADLRIRKLGVVKNAWNLSQTPKTSNFEKKSPQVTHRDGYQHVWRPNCLKAYSTATRFFRKMSEKLAQKQFGPRRRTYRNFTKRRKNRFLSDAKM